MWTSQQLQIIQETIQTEINRHGAVEPQRLVDAVRSAFNDAGIPYDSFGIADIQTEIPDSAPLVGFVSGWM